MKGVSDVISFAEDLIKIGRQNIRVGADEAGAIAYAA